MSLVMPGRDLGYGLQAADAPVLGLQLKAHKNLPRQHFLTANNPRLQDPYSTSERIRSWMADPHPNSKSQDSNDAAAEIRLTPQLNGSSNYKSWIDDDKLGKRGRYEKHHKSEADGDQAVPASSRSDLALPGNRASIVTDNTLDGTDSFQTANEVFYHSDLSADDATVVRPHEPFKQRWSQKKELNSPKAVGLGLGLESDDEPTPTAVTPKARNDMDEYVALEDVWGGETPGRIHDQLEEQKMLQEDGAYVEETPLVETDGVTSPSLHLESPRTHHPSSLTPPQSLMVEKLSESEMSEKASPSLREEDIAKLEAEVRDMDEKRLSQASTGSTVIAMLVDSPPRRKQTLRHTGRLLDSKNTEHGGVRKTSMGHSPSLRRRERNTQSPEGDLRKSYAADAGVKKDTSKLSSTSSLMVIPDRRGSVQSSTAAGKGHSKTFSSSSRQSSSRPTTAPEDTPVSYFDAPRPHRRSVSVVIQQARPLKHSRKMALSPIAQSSTQASVQPSTEPSRSTSVTSAGLKTHFVPATPPHEGGMSVNSEVDEEIERSQAGTLVAHNRNQADVVTPFSLRSTHSSTPGTLEVNEATALSIHPHTNRSILVIQEATGRDELGSPREQSTIIARNASIAIPAFMAQDLRQYQAPKPPPVLHVTDSPLQNPREPPPPPDLIKVIPPTPANAHASSEAIVAAGDAAKANRRSGPLSSVRRAFSARQHAESGRTRTSITRTFSLRPTSQRRFSFEEGTSERESHLYPSWRPRRNRTSYLSDSDSEFGDGVLHPTPPLTNPTPKRTMSLTDRVTSAFRSASIRHPRRRTASVSAPSPTNSDPYAAANEDDSHLPYEVVDQAIKQRQPLTRRLTNSLRLPTRMQQVPLFTPRTPSSSGGGGGGRDAPAGLDLGRIASRARRRAEEREYEFEPYMPAPMKRRVNGAGIVGARGSGYGGVPVTGADGTVEEPPPRQGYAVDYMVRGLRERWERRRLGKEEREVEERRRKLRGRIGVVGPSSVGG